MHCNQVFLTKRFWNSTSCRSTCSVAGMKLAAHVVLPHSWFCNTTGAAIPLQQSRFCDIARKRKIGFATRLHYHGRVHCNRVLPAKRFCVSTSCRSPYSVADMKFAAPVVLPHSWFCNTAGAATLPKNGRSVLQHYFTSPGCHRHLG